MALDSTNLKNLQSVGSKNVYLYSTSADTMSTVQGSNYFLNAYFNLHVGDIIVVTATNGTTALAVTAASSTSVTTEYVQLSSTTTTFSQGVEVEIADTENDVALTLDQNDVTNNPTVLKIENAGTGADIETEALTLTNGLIVPASGVAMEIQKANNSGNVVVLTLDNNDATNNPTTLKIENAGTGADIDTEALTLTNGKIVLTNTVGVEIENAAAGNAVALTIDQNDTTGNNTALKIENAGTGADVETEALSLTNGKIVLVNTIGLEVENAAAGNAVAFTIDQNDTTGNNTALKIENAGTGADIETEALTLTNGLIVPASGVAMEIQKANDSGNVVAFTIDNNDATNNPTSLKIENAGTGADIDTEALTLTNGKIVLTNTVGVEIENAAAGNAVALTIDQNDTTGNNTALKIENAGTGADIETEALTLTNGLIVPASGVAMEIQKADDSGNVVAFTIDNNDVTNNPTSLKIENAGSGADIDTEALTLTNGKIVLANTVGVEIENAAAGNAVAFTIDQNDTTGNNTALKIENAGTGADIETEALTLTNGLIVPASGVAMEIQKANNSGNVVAFTIDNNDATNNPTSLKIENAGSGADIDTEALTLTNGLIVPASGVSIEVQKANDSGNVPAFVVDNDDATNNPSSLKIENAGSGADIEAPNFTLTNGVLSAVNLTTSGLLFISMDTKSGPGALSITKTLTMLTTTGAGDALTLADGASGQVKLVMCVGDGGTGVITPANMTNGTNVTLTSVNDAVMFIWDGAGWEAFIFNGATIA